MKTWRRKGKAFLLCAGLWAASCKSDDGGDAQRDAGPSGLEAGPGIDAAASRRTPLEGRVLDADTGRGVPAAELKSKAGDRARSAADGTFSLPIVDEPTEIAFERAEYAPTTKRAPGPHAGVEVFLKGVDARAEFRADEGVTLSLPSGGRIKIPADAVLDSKGEAAKGKLTLEVAEVDGRDRMQASALPGDLRARSGKKKGLASLERAIEARISDEKGERMQLDEKGGAYVDVRDTRDKTPSEQTAFSFDDETGEWVAEGTAARSEDGYRIDLAHLSWWSYGELVEEVGCVRACVEEGGRPAVGAQVWLVGASVVGVQSVFSDATGCVAADVAAGAELVLVAQAGGRVSQSLSYRVSARKGSASDDASACEAAGTLVLDGQPSADCPVGSAICGDECVDTLMGASAFDCTMPPDAAVRVDGGHEAGIIDSGLPVVAPVLVLDAGTTQTVDAGDAVSLAATVSGVTSFAVSWTQLSGPSVTLSAASTLNPSFSAPAPTVDTLLVFRVQATSTLASPVSDDVAVLVRAVANAAPVVNAGADQIVKEGVSVSLAGSATDADGSIASVGFAQIGGPAVALSAVDALEASFTAPNTSAVTTLVFELFAEDDRGAGASDVMLVTVQPDNQPPSATAGGSVVVPENANGNLDGTATDPDGSIVRTVWSQIGGPAAAIANADALDTTFTPPDVSTPATLVFELEIEDDDGARARDTLVVDVLPVVNGNVAPLAYAGPDRVVATGSGAQLTATASDADGSIASLAWQQISGTSVTLSDAAAPNPTFNAPSVTCPQNLVFELTVTDDLGAISKDRVGVVVSAGLASPLALGSVQGFEGATGGLTTPGTLWQRGAPTSGPSRANKGSNVWATNLTGNYPDNANEVLCLPPIARAGSDEVTLSVYAWVSAYGGDGLTIQALSPELGWTNVSTSPATPSGGFTSLGRQGDYALLTASVPAWATDSAHLRFVFQSNTGATAAGAYLDDLSVYDETSDPDGDGLLGVVSELAAHGTDPFVADTDGDGIDDGAEVQAGTSPLEGSDFEGAPTLQPGDLLDFEGGDCGGLTALAAAAGERTLMPDTLWQCGVVGSGPGRAHSGTRAWATNLTGNYPDNAVSFLYLPAIDLSSVSDADLSFRLWSAAYGGDALSVQVEASPNVWIGLSPITPLYNGTDALGAAGFASIGAQNQYSLVIIPLTGHAGDSQVRLRFSMRSNAGAVHAGFYIDDVAVHGVDADPDADGVTGVREEWAAEGTDPMRADSDGDGSSDGQERTAGTDALNPADYAGAVTLVPPASFDFETSDGQLAAMQTFPDDTEPMPDDRWRHGVIASGPGVAASGTRVWATVLNGNYADLDRSYLYLPAIDLRGLTGADLSFRLWASCYGGDGLSVEAESDEGTWAALTPLTPAYNGVDGNGQPAWNTAGSQTDYSLVIVRLDAYAGKARVKLRLAFRSNAGAVLHGAYVDDLGIHGSAADPDADGLLGVSAEWSQYGTDPFVTDTDADGVGDGQEVTAGTGPLNPADNSLITKLVPGDLLDFETDDGGLIALSPVTGEGDFKPDTLWQWGAPGSGPGKAFSGSQVWATNLTGAYRDNDVSYLYLPPIDLSSVEDADLSFRMWSSTYGSDGLSVEVQTVSGAWARLSPLTPAYNGTDATGASAWNTLPSFWYYTLAIIPLTAYAGEPAVKVRFAFRSNAGAVLSGFYLDDVGIHGPTQDPDGDGLLGVSAEWSSHGTDPLVADSDGDGVGDGQETAQGTLPSDPADFPAASTMVAGDLFSLESSDGDLATNGILWSYGSVGNGPGKGASGVRAWCTRCTGAYFDLAEEYLYLPPMQIPVAASSTFALHLWNEVYGSDGLSLEIWDAALGWQALAVDPIKPYNATDGAGKPAWGSLVGTKYHFAAAPLGAWSGKKVRLRFAFRSNGGAVLSGSYLDDFALADEATSDPDGDGLVGLLSEYKTYGTDPLVADTDGDGVSDGVEVTNATNPLNASSF